MQHGGSVCAHLLGCFSCFLPPGGRQHSRFCGLLQSSSISLECSDEFVHEQDIRYTAGIGTSEQVLNSMPTAKRQGKA